MKAGIGTDSEGGRYVHFFCPGCDEVHSVKIGIWNFNEDLERPTITPSLLCHSHQTLIDKELEGDALTAPENVTMSPRCHSFITNGYMIYLEDSTHQYAGQTIELPDWPPYRDGQD